MKIDIEKTSEVERKLSIEIPWDRYQDEIRVQVSRIQKRAVLKGFRKGKAPIEMVRRIYAEDAHQEAVNALAAEAVKDAVDKHDLKPFGNPYLTDVKTEKDKAVVMEAMVELEPVFELADYSNLELEKPAAEASDEEINQLLERLRENRGETAEMTEDRGLRKDDIAIINYAGSKQGVPLEEIKGKDFLVRVGLAELIPGFEEQLLGMKKGETREFDLTFPEDFAQAEFAGQPIHFSVHLKEIRALQLPEVDEDFAKSFGKFENVADLMEGIRKDIVKNKEEESSKELRGNLARRLVEDNIFDVPPSLVDRELRNVVQEYGENLRNAGVSSPRIREMILQNEGRLKKTAEEHIRLLYIVGEIAEKEDIKATAEEIQSVIAKRAGSTGRDVEELKEEYARDGTLADIGFTIARDKVFQKLLEEAKVKEIKVQAEKKEKKGGKTGNKKETP